MNYKNRAVKIAKYLIENPTMTVRSLSKKFKISKSVVHTDLTKKLRVIDWELATKVGEIFEHHKEIKHLNGGEATRQVKGELKMKFGLYNQNGLVDICYEPSEKKARATFRKWYGLNSLRGWRVWPLNDEDGWYTDNMDAIQSSANYQQGRVVK